MKSIINKILISSVLLLIMSCSSAVRYNSFSSLNKSKKQSNQQSNKQGKKRSNNRENKHITLQQSEIIRVAKSWLGTPYKYGGTSKKGIDCSAFVQNVYKDLGLSLPRTAARQYKYSSRNKVSQREVGDLVFFGKTNKISHVGIYIGDGNLIHASSKKGVIIQSINNSYLKQKYHSTCRLKQDI